MKPRESFICQPIRDLQTMLRVIQKFQKKQELLIPDGIYSSDTIHAVSDFQKEHGLPPTGATDLATWDAILDAYLPARINLVPAQSLQILLEPGEELGKDCVHPNLYLVQAVLEVLSGCYRSILRPSFSGTLDEKTEKSLLSFQHLSRLPETGCLDKCTWKHLALQFPLGCSIIKAKKEP